MKNIAMITILVLIQLPFLFCKTSGSTGTDSNGGSNTTSNNGTNSNTLQTRSELPVEFRRSGMVSSSTYQVFITIFSGNENEARLKGMQEARQKAYNLMLQEPFIPRNLTDQGRRDIKILIDENGKLVKIVREAENTWSLVLQINKNGLRTYLQQLR